ncbi:hypothetical protein AB0L57_16595 [Nocardia sp. NPDC052254]|uniref:hypothetical protein n=1 Tax=Nocardia sp. NPDC052254 TaxID=3155681 RepID=UPI00343F2A2E
MDPLKIPGEFPDWLVGSILGHSPDYKVENGDRVNDVLMKCAAECKNAAARFDKNSAAEQEALSGAVADSRAPANAQTAQYLRNSSEHALSLSGQLVSTRYNVDYTNAMIVSGAAVLLIMITAELALGGPTGVAKAAADRARTEAGWKAAVRGLGNLLRKVGGQATTQRAAWPLARIVGRGAVMGGLGMGATDVIAQTYLVSTGKWDHYEVGNILSSVLVGAGSGAVGAGVAYKVAPWMNRSIGRSAGANPKIADHIVRVALLGGTSGIAGAGAGVGLQAMLNGGHMPTGEELKAAITTGLFGGIAGALPAGLAHPAPGASAAHPTMPSRSVSADVPVSKAVDAKGLSSKALAEVSGPVNSPDVKLPSSTNLPENRSGIKLTESTPGLFPSERAIDSIPVNSSDVPLRVPENFSPKTSPEPVPVDASNVVSQTQEPVLVGAVAEGKGAADGAAPDGPRMNSDSPRGPSEPTPKPDTAPRPASPVGGQSDSSSSSGTGSSGTGGSHRPGGGSTEGPSSSQAPRPPTGGSGDSASGSPESSPTPPGNGTGPETNPSPPRQGADATDGSSDSSVWGPRDKESVYGPPENVSVWGPPEKDVLGSPDPTVWSGGQTQGDSAGQPLVGDGASTGEPGNPGSGPGAEDIGKAQTTETPHPNRAGATDTATDQGAAEPAPPAAAKPAETTPPGEGPVTRTAEEGSGTPKVEETAGPNDPGAAQTSTAARPAGSGGEASSGQVVPPGAASASGDRAPSGGQQNPGSGTGERASSPRASESGAGQAGTGPAKPAAGAAESKPGGPAAAETGAARPVREWEPLRPRTGEGDDTAPGASQQPVKVAGEGEATDPAQPAKPDGTEPGEAKPDRQPTGPEEPAARQPSEEREPAQPSGKADETFAKRQEELQEERRQLDREQADNRKAVEKHRAAGDQLDHDEAAAGQSELNPEQRKELQDRDKKWVTKADRLYDEGRELRARNDALSAKEQRLSEDLGAARKQLDGEWEQYREKLSAHQAESEELNADIARNKQALEETDRPGATAEHNGKPSREHLLEEKKALEDRQADLADKKDKLYDTDDDLNARNDALCDAERNLRESQRNSGQRPREEEPPGTAKSGDAEGGNPDGSSGTKGPDEAGSPERPSTPEQRVENLKAEQADLRRQRLRLDRDYELLRNDNAVKDAENEINLSKFSKDNPGNESGLEDLKAKHAEKMIPREKDLQAIKQQLDDIHGKLEAKQKELDELQNELQGEPDGEAKSNPDPDKTPEPGSELPRDPSNGTPRATPPPMGEPPKSGDGTGAGAPDGAAAPKGDGEGAAPKGDGEAGAAKPSDGESQAALERQQKSLEAEKAKLEKERDALAREVQELKGRKASQDAEHIKEIEKLVGEKPDDLEAMNKLRREQLEKEKPLDGELKSKEQQLADKQEEVKEKDGELGGVQKKLHGEKDTDKDGSGKGDKDTKTKNESDNGKNDGDKKDPKKKFDWGKVKKHKGLIALGVLAAGGYAYSQKWFPFGGGSDDSSDDGGGSDDTNTPDKSTTPKEKTPAVTPAPTDSSTTTPDPVIPNLPSVNTPGLPSQTPSSSLTPSSLTPSQSISPIDDSTSSPTSLDPTGSGAQPDDSSSSDVPNDLGSGGQQIPSQQNPSQQTGSGLDGLVGGSGASADPTGGMGGMLGAAMMMMSMLGSGTGSDDYSDAGYDDGGVAQAPPAAPPPAVDGTQPSDGTGEAPADGTGADSGEGADPESDKDSDPDKKPEDGTGTDSEDGSGTGDDSKPGSDKPDGADADKKPDGDKPSDSEADTTPGSESAPGDGSTPGTDDGSSPGDGTNQDQTSGDQGQARGDGSESTPNQGSAPGTTSTDGSAPSPDQSSVPEATSTDGSGTSPDQASDTGTTAGPGSGAPIQQVADTSPAQAGDRWEFGVSPRGSHPWSRLATTGPDASAPPSRA